MKKQAGRVVRERQCEWAWANAADRTSALVLGSLDLSRGQTGSGKEWWGSIMTVGRFVMPLERTKTCFLVENHRNTGGRTALNKKKKGQFPIKP